MPPISRRRFLALGALGAVSACTGGDDEPDASAAPATSPPATAAPTTAAATTTTATTTTSTTTTTVLEPPPLELAEDPFTLGVAAGDPDATSVILWTRLAPAAATLADEIDLLWEVAADDAFGDIIDAGLVTARAAEGHSVHVEVDLDGASWYRFRAGSWTSPTGRARSSPANGSAAEPLRIASTSCQNWEHGFYTAYGDLVEWQPDLVLFLGDFIYEGAGRDVGDGGRVRSHGSSEPADLAAYRDRYALYLSDPLLSGARAACPWLVVWDDHEVENNYAGLTPQDPADAAGFAARRAAAYRAWWEHMPVRLPPPALDAPGYAIHREIAWGDLVTIDLLDGRQHRDDQACGDVVLDTNPACIEALDQERTMLGAEQESWIVERLAAAGATWQLIGQQTVITDLRLPNSGVLNYDQWDGYAPARERLLRAAEPVANVVVVTGDIHLAGVGRLSTPEGAPVGVEFVTSSISSDGNVDPSFTAVLADFPNVVDAELAHRGYIRHTITPAEWTADYRIVADAKLEDAPVTTWKTFHVAAGSTEVTVGV